ncbi:hypothetical protein EMIT0194MI4_10232 [Pseudomonas sp. IT-194MI4]
MTDKISSHESAILNDFSERPQTSSLEPVDSGCLEELLLRDTRLIYWRTLSDSPSVVSAAAETGSGNGTANEGVICIRHHGVAILLG